MTLKRGWLALEGGSELLFFRQDWVISLLQELRPTPAVLTGDGGKFWLEVAENCCTSQEDPEFSPPEDGEGLEKRLKVCGSFVLLFPELHISVQQLSSSLVAYC